MPVERPTARIRVSEVGQPALPVGLLHTSCPPDGGVYAKEIIHHNSVYRKYNIVYIEIVVIIATMHANTGDILLYSLRFTQTFQE